MSAGVSAVIPTYGRYPQLADSLRRIMACEPPPDEIIVHVDHGDEETLRSLRRDFPAVGVLTSERRMGPGGGRNKLVAAAAHGIVASFDDDSYPLDRDYFARLRAVFAARPDAAAVAAAITDKGIEVQEAQPTIQPAADFGGGGVAYDRKAFMQTGGYVPLVVAYGMEEVDLCLRLIDAGHPIYFSRWLRVFHDNDRSGHASARVTAGSIRNLALLVYLRYPLRYWPFGALQVINRIVWLIRHRRIRGVVSGLAGIPAHLWTHRSLRRPVGVQALKAFLRARRIPAIVQPLVPPDAPNRPRSPQETTGISVVIPTYRRAGQLQGTLSRLAACVPPPDEVLVHIDAGDEETEPLLSRSFPSVRILRSDSRQGPGGGRNKLVAAAAHEIVASFDDDSYPLDRDYFARLGAVFAAQPDAAIIASRIVNRGDPVPEARAEIASTVLFVGCGVAYRRDAFLGTGGYVPLPVAYGMEEVDLGLRLTDQGRAIYISNWLRVLHDTDLEHHASARVTSGSIANIALLVFLRYPPLYWPYGVMQLANRLAWLLREGRFTGIASGLARIPRHLWEHRRLRDRVSRGGLASFLRARRVPVQFRALGL